MLRFRNPTFVPLIAAMALGSVGRADALSLLDPPGGPLGTEPVSDAHFILTASPVVRPFALVRYSRRFGELGPHLDVRLRAGDVSTDVQLAPTNPARLVSASEVATRPLTYTKAGVRFRFVDVFFFDLYMGYQVGERNLFRAGLTFGFGAPPQPRQ